MISKLIKGLLAYITIVGLVTFSQFMLEESFQTAMFGTWPAQDAKDWPTVKAGSALMTGINRTLKIVNYGCGWIQPLAFISYRAYTKSADYYVTSLNAKIRAHAPELFVGETITLEFTPSNQMPENDNHFGWVRLQCGKIRVLVDDAVTLGKSIKVSGELQQTDAGILFIDLRD